MVSFTRLAAAFSIGLTFLASFIVVPANANALDDYVSKADPNFKWHNTGHNFTTVFGGTAYVLNVTSQQWLDASRGVGPNGAIWTHQVVLVVPKHVVNGNVSIGYLTGGCNNGEPDKPPSKTDEDLLVVDETTWAAKSPGIVVYQIPNCPYVFPTDPLQKKRSEDALIAYAWGMFINDTDHNPEWLPRLAMTKAAMAAFKATEEFASQFNIKAPLQPGQLVATDIAIKGWVVAGASKRGWTTWMVGAVKCPTCPNIVGIAPLVPIVPAMAKEIHRMIQSYNGFTFAFTDYTDLNLPSKVNDPVFQKLLDLVDPLNYMDDDRLGRLPKTVVLSSNDEFMMFDWSNIWSEDISGEFHLLIAPNSEHSLSTGIPEILSTLGAFVASIASGQTSADRPKFKYEYSEKDGAVSVMIPDDVPHGKVRLRHAETMQDVRRDFRWVRQANNNTQPCKLPFIPLPSPIFGGNCLQPIIWHAQELKAEKPGVYKATPPKPKDGFWTGYFIEIEFPSPTTVTKEVMQLTTPGYIFPNTLPFPDCTKGPCELPLV